MNRQELAHLGVLFVLAIALRILLFDKVGVFGDFGYWAYDSRMIRDGLKPFIDFPGRSPAMLYLLAVVRDLFGQPIYTLRGTVIVLWMLTGIPVYLLAREIHSHYGGLGALGVFLLTPYPLIYGMFLNSQALGALLGTAAVYCLYRYEGVGAYAVVGILLGAAFLSRRSVIVFLGPIAVFTLWRQYRDGGAWLSAIRTSLVRGVTLSGGFLGALLVGYVAVAGWDLSLGLAIFNIDFVGLFTSNGRGAYPMVGQRAPPVDVQVTGGVPILQSICPVCGTWTARRGLRMLILSLPIMGLFFYYFRDLDHHYFSDADRLYMMGGLAPLAVYAIFLAVNNGFLYRAAAVIVLALFVAIVYHTPRLTRDLLYRPGMVLVALIFATIVLGYLYRERRIIVYYMMDAWPMISILTGIIGVAVWQKAERAWRVALIAAVLCGVIISASVAVPLAEVMFEPEPTHWFTLGTLQVYSADMNSRTTAEDRVLTGHPSYIAGSDALLYQNDTRTYMAAMLYDDAGVGEQLFHELSRSLRRGGVSYVVMQGQTEEMIRANATVETAFREYFCEVPDDEVYRRTNAHLYRYRPDCPEGGRWT